MAECVIFHPIMHTGFSIQRHVVSYYSSVGLEIRPVGPCAALLNACALTKSYSLQSWTYGTLLVATTTAVVLRYPWTDAQHKALFIRTQT